MRRPHFPGSTVVALLAALTTWLTMTTWTGFSEEPHRFLVPIAVGCGLVAVVGATLRSVHLPLALVVLCQLAVLALFLNHQLAGDSSLLGFIPTPGSISDSFRTLGDSVDASRIYAAPVPANVTEFPALMIVIGTLVALTVDLLACGLRMVPAAGLPLLAMYTAPVSLLTAGVDWWKFALVALCFLAMLAGEESGRLTHWGHDLGIASDQTPHRQWSKATNQNVWPAARKIGVTATGLAVVAPLLIPTFTGGILGASGTGLGDAGSQVAISNPIVDMRGDLEAAEDIPLLSLSTSAADPDYIRLAVLDKFDGREWSPSPRDIPVSHRVEGRTLPAPPGLDNDVQTTRETYRFSVTPTFSSQWLPAPYPTVELQVRGDWRYDPRTLDFVSAIHDRTTSGLQYEGVGLDVEATSADLAKAAPAPADISRPNTEVDPSVPEWVSELAHRVTTLGTNQFERAILLQDWFAKPHDDPASGPDFVYSLQNAPVGSGVDGLTQFLRHTRTGYCEQFASAMALMARTLGIPARVVVGFVNGERGSDRRWTYSTHDLHAWPELYFEGVGWMRFEPTPATGRQGTSTPPYAQVVIKQLPPTSVATSGTPTELASPGGGPSKAVPTEPTSPTAATDNGGGAGRLLVVGGVLLVLVLLGCLPRLARVVVRRRRWGRATTTTERAEAAWAELRDSVLDHRLPWDDRVSVRARAEELQPSFCRHPGVGEEGMARVIRNNPAATAALARLVEFVERSRYALSVSDLPTAQADVALCVEAVRIGLEPGQRRRADWLPISLLRRPARPVTTEPGLVALSEPTLR